MPFEKLSHVKISKYTGEPLSTSTVRVYTQRLTILSKEGYDTKDSLLKSHKKIIEFIKSLDADNQYKRGFFSAIFYALDEYPQDKQKPYYDAFQGFKDPKPVKKT